LPPAVFDNADLHGEINRSDVCVNKYSIVYVLLFVIAALARDGCVLLLKYKDKAVSEGSTCVFAVTCILNL